MEFVLLEDELECGVDRGNFLGKGMYLLNINMLVILIKVKKKKKCLLSFNYMCILNIVDKYIDGR